MSVHSRTLKDKVFFHKYALWDRRSKQEYRELLRNQTLSLDELSAMNWEKRKDIVRFAYEKVPFYKRLYKQKGFHPGDLKNPGDFSDIPVLKRDHLRDFNNELFAEGATLRNAKRSTTGGTTGMPVRTYLDRNVSHAPMGWRMLGWWGLSPADHIGIIWRKVGSPARQWLDRLIWWPTKQLFLNASQMSTDNIGKFISRFNRVRPPVLHGYVGAVHHLAEHIEKWNTPLTPLRAVWVTCSPLTQSHRSYMERIFNAPVYDQYGSCEVYWLSAQCGLRKGHHVFFDRRYIEFTDREGKNVPDGAEGNILVTDLENRVFPIIRYDIGDVGRSLKHPCACGVTLPLMDAVKGKRVDLIKFPDGTCISDMNVIFDDFPDVIKGFQVVQKADYSITVNYIPSADRRHIEVVLNTIRARINSQSGGQAVLSFQEVGSIPHIRGKLKYIISELEDTPSR